MRPPSEMMRGSWVPICLLTAWALACKAQPSAESHLATGTPVSGAAERAAIEGAATGSAAASSSASTPRVLYLPDAAATAAETGGGASTGAKDAPKPAGPKLRCRVAAIGDSLTDPRSHGGKYLNYLQEHCPDSLFDNYGVGGQMVNQMRRRFERDVLQKRVGPEQQPYTHVIVFGGVNDLYSDLTAKRSNEKIERDLLAMYSAAKQRGMQVVAFTVSPWGGFGRYFNERRGHNTALLNRWMFEQLEHGTVDHVIDSYALLSCGSPSELCPEYARPFKDGLHFGPGGHTRLGVAALENAFKDCR